MMVMVCSRGILEAFYGERGGGSAMLCSNALNVGFSSSVGPVCRRAMFFLSMAVVP